MSRCLVILAVAVGTLSWTAPAAAAPANDNFSNAEALAGPDGTVSGTTIGATSQPGEPCAIEVWGCGPSVWYTWQTPAATTTQVSFDTCPAAWDTTLGVFTGNSLATLEAVAEDDGACGLGSRVDFAAIPGTTYSIRVGGYGFRSGTFHLGHCEGAACPADTDGDGVFYPTDNCPTGDSGWTSSATTDHDSDGCRDAGEDSDDDDDGKADGSDACPAGDIRWIPNATIDNDSDGCRDSTEDSDDDNDTVADASDNCRLVANTDQTNTDGDPQGDACDSNNAALEQKLTASDGAQSDTFGTSVAVDGDTIAVGAPADDFQRGAVYVYQRVDDSWTQTAKLTASDGDAGDRLGQSVAIDGDTIVAGAVHVSVGENEYQGSIYTFARTGAAARTETAKLTASDGATQDFLGFSVAIDGDTIVAGTTWGDVGGNLNQGSAYTFARTGAAARTETAKLTSSDGAASDSFGARVAIDGDTIVASAVNDQVGANSGQGSVYTFARTGAAARTETAKLTASDGKQGDQLYPVAIAGDTIVAGAISDDVGENSDQGSVYTFASTGAPARNETAKLTASDGAANSKLGISVAIDGDKIVAGGAGFVGAVYTFARTGAAARTETAKLIAPDDSPADQLGLSVAIDGDAIVAGALSDDVGDNLDQGSATAFFSPADSDEDGVRDSADDCPTGAATGLDTDGDGCKDAGEDPDDDNDGKADGADNCAAGELGWTSNATTDNDSDGCRDAGEDPDDDNDTVADGSDDCRTLPASTPSGCPDVTRSLTLSYSQSKQKFKGALAASEPSCISNDLVTVWKQVSGDDAKVGTDEVNARGRYAVSKRRRPGKYYSTVDERVVSDVAACGSATSPTLQLR